MASPAATIAGPGTTLATAPSAVARDPRDLLRSLEHAVRFNLPRLRAVHDDPCKPAQRVLLAEVIDALTTAVTNQTGSNP